MGTLPMFSIYAGGNRMLRRLVVIGSLAALLMLPALAGASVGVSLDPGDTLPVDCPTTLSLNGTTLECAEEAATSTPEPTQTATSTPDPTATSTPTATAEPTATTPAPTATEGETGCTVPAGAGTWHAPTDHEHGDAPPAWADAWSCDQFGHPVIFGGDEQTSHEHLNKERAFKGYHWTARADDGGDLEIFLRLHMQTNPLGRAASFHSYEMYAARDGVVLYFVQGWRDFGPSPEQRNTFADASVWQIVPMYDPANHIIGSHPDGNPFYVPGATGTEFWYSQSTAPGGWDPVIIVDIYDPSTYMTVGEATDTAAWLPTGDMGLDRRVFIRFIVEGTPLQTVSGQPYIDRNMDDPRGWFCTDTFGVIDPSCDTGSLLQYIDPAMPTIGDTGPGAQYRNQWTCEGCQLPN